MTALIGSQTSTPNNGNALSLPAGGEVDDLILIFVGFNDSGAPANPSWAGYTKTEESLAGGNSSQLWYRRMSGDANDTPNLSTGETQIAVVTAIFRGPFDWTTILEADNSHYFPSTGSVKSLPEITTSHDRSLIVTQATNDDNFPYSAWTFANASMTEIAEIADPSTRLGCAWGTQATAGGVGAGTVTLSAAGADGTMITAGFHVSPHAFFDLTNTPADFGTADSANLEVRAKTVGVGGTPLKLMAQIFQSDEITTMSDEVEAASIGTDGAFTNYTVAFTGLDTAANKTTWDAARIRFRWTT